MTPRRFVRTAVFPVVVATACGIAGEPVRDPPGNTDRTSTAAAANVANEGVFLVSGRRRRGGLVVGPTDARAAGELVRVLRDSTGTPGLLSAPSEADALHIHVGRTPFVEQAGLGLEGLPPFAYRIRLVDGDNLVLAGGEAPATRYAVADFLRRFCGYRAFMPGQLGEVTPSRDAVEIPEDLDLLEAPSVPSYTVAWSEVNGFCRNARTTLQATHSLSAIFPPGMYAASHPEYYPMVGGERFVPAPDLSVSWQPCVSNPDLPSIAASWAGEYFAKNALALGFPAGVNDGAGDCQCPKCTAWRKRYANQYIPFYNAVARELRAACPGKLLCFIAYDRGAAPVPKSVQIEPNVLVEVVGGLKNDMSLLKRWKAAGARNIGIYEYMYGHGYVVPRHYPHIMGQAWKAAFRRFGLKSIWQEFYPVVPLYDGARQYVLDQLAWNMDADIDELLGDYFSSFYVEAARPVREFFDRIEAVYGCKRDPLDPMADWKKPAQLAEYTWDDLRFLDMKLAEAAALVRDEAAAKRLHLLRTIFGLSRLYIEGHLAWRELENAATIDSEAAASDVLRYAALGLADSGRIDEYVIDETDQQQIFAKGDLDTYRNLPTLKIRSLIEDGADGAFAEVTRYLAENGGWDKARAFWLGAAAATEDTALQDLCRTQIYLREDADAQTNLVLSPGFEPTDEIPSPVDGVRDIFDWEELDTKLPGWSTWHYQRSVTQFSWDRGERHTGEYSVAIRENQIRGCFLTRVRVTPGCRYHLSVWVKQIPADKGGHLVVRWQDSKGWVDQGPDAAAVLPVSYPQSPESAWRQIDVSFTAPPGATHCVPLLEAPRQAPEEAIWFDDFVLRRIYAPAHSAIGENTPLPAVEETHRER